MNSNYRIPAALYSLGTWFFRNVSENTLHKGDDGDDDDDDNNKNNNNINNSRRRSGTTNQTLCSKNIENRTRQEMSTMSETSSVNSPLTPCKNLKTKNQYSIHGENLES
jgi:hypothetical protein